MQRLEVEVVLIGANIYTHRLHGLIKAHSELPAPVRVRQKCIGVFLLSSGDQRGAQCVCAPRFLEFLTAAQFFCQQAWGDDLLQGPRTTPSVQVVHRIRSHVQLLCGHLSWIVGSLKRGEYRLKYQSSNSASICESNETYGVTESCENNSAKPVSSAAHFAKALAVFLSAQRSKENTSGCLLF